MGSCLMVDIGEYRVAPVPVCPLTQILAFFVGRSSRSVLSPSNGVMMLICPREPVNTSSSNPPALYQSAACRPSPLLAPLQHHEYHAHHPTKSPINPQHRPKPTPHQPIHLTTHPSHHTPSQPDHNNNHGGPVSPPTHNPITSLQPQLGPNQPTQSQPSIQTSHPGTHSRSVDRAAKHPMSVARTLLHVSPPLWRGPHAHAMELGLQDRAFPISTHPVCMYTVPETTYSTYLCR